MLAESEMRAKAAGFDAVAQNGARRVNESVALEAREREGERNKYESSFIIFRKFAISTEMVELDGFSWQVDFL